MRVKRKLSDTYRFDGFRPEEGKVRGVFGQPKARILPLKRRSKKLVVVSAERNIEAGTTESCGRCETSHAETHICIWRSSSDAWTAGNARR
jgi:hypothetical protein